MCSFCTTYNIIKLRLLIIYYCILAAYFFYVIMYNCMHMCVRYFVDF